MAPPQNDRKRRRQDSESSAATRSHDPDGGISRTPKKAKVEDRRSVFVRSLPPSATNESLADFFSQYFPVKHATVVVDQKTKESRGFGFVAFADADDAKAAKEALDKKEWDGRRIRIEVAEPRHRNPDPESDAVVKKAGRAGYEPPSTKLIIRNLPWSIKTSDQLAKLFISYGKVKFADLPQDKGKLKGFGFVTLRGRPNAEKALEAVNGKVIDGRTLAVDWAVDKATWDKQQTAESKNNDQEPKGGNDEEQEDEKAAAGGKDGEVKNRDDQLQSDLANFMKNYMHNMEDEEDEDEGEEKDDDDEEEDDEDMKLLDQDEEEEEKEPAKPKRELMTDNSSTVFVRNLPFTTTDEQLQSFFGHFGKVRYARVVIDKATEKPAGTGFVCFVDAADAKACIVGAPRRAQPPAGGVKHSILQDENADPTGRYTLDGRVLQVAQAVGRNEAANLAENSLAQRRQKDKRRLYLLAEGQLGAGSPLRGLLTDAEVRMRQASAAQRKKLVEKNPMLHISLTRLALRNIPTDLGSKDLKELARKAVVGFAKDVREGRRQPLSKEENARDGKDAKEKEKERKLKRKGIVKQAKIVFEDNKGSKVSEASGAGKSRGYGFIEYTSHRWALMGLRYLNGLQLDAPNGKKQRLIVEFAIENAQVVKRREAAEKAARSVDDEDEDGEEEAPEPKKKTTNGKQKGKKNKGNMNKGPMVKKPAKEEDGDKEKQKEKEKKPTNAKEAIQQKLIARKRLMRKKKAVSRGKA
ncbi:RNA-binding domain-containing protein [Trichoderma citrinoviride]|uniref:RNA-binding domain-containing protein n=1 Tax=Trichoderma citrinoviride TaxID=58853 RepID=A0A2T4BB73_9HYPO|nr:RNA-binding domain-containing protein [Trichoderma citrinoviride]PTB66566.1 RNA-binding domain-containing protein [Trichoderma citrinoviride]